MDVTRMRKDVVDGARMLVERHPDVAAIVFECTNFPPFAYAVAEATGPAGLRPDHGRRLGCRGAPEAALSGPALKVAAKAAAKAAPVTEQMSIIEAIRRGPP